MNIYLIKTVIEDKETLLLTIVNPSVDPDAKLSAKSILGFVVDPDKPVSSDNVKINPVFIDHFHKTIIFFARFNDGIIHLVEQQQNGFVYIKDQRNKDEAETRPQDIIGSFEVKDGVLIHESYVPNPAYQFISGTGGFELQKELEALLYSTAY